MCGRDQISQRQSTACRRVVAGNENRVASSASSVGVWLSPIKKPTVTHSTRQESPRSSEVRRSAGAVGRGCSMEQRHVWSCLGVEQQACIDSLGWLQQTPQHCFESHRRSFDSHALVAGTTPARTIAAINAIEETVFITGRNMTNTPFCVSITLELSYPDSTGSSLDLNARNGAAR